MSKSIKLEAVHYEMLLAVSKRLRMKPEQLIEEFIQQQFNAKK